nr:MAG TPA: hypothetical protein [Caudoviricetes sp.]
MFLSSNIKELCSILLIELSTDSLQFNGCQLMVYNHFLGIFRLY